LFALEGWADPDQVARYRNHWGTPGQFGKFCRLARAEGCREVVFIGKVLRPALSQLKFDFGALKVIPSILASFRGGDNHLLSGIAQLFEREGFRIVGAHQVAPEILLPIGTLGRYRPSARDRTDIERAIALVRAIGPFDVGQAAVVGHG